jgi:hypothetical protein
MTAGTIPKRARRPSICPSIPNKIWRAPRQKFNHRF